MKNGTFESSIINFGPGGVVYLGAKDFLNSGVETGVDLLIGRSGLGCQGDASTSSAGMWLYRNLGANAAVEENRFVTDSVPLSPLSDHLDFAAIGELDYDEDGFPDFVAGSNARWGSTITVLQIRGLDFMKPRVQRYRRPLMILMHRICRS